MAALRESGVTLPKALPAAVRGRAGDHVFLLELAAALAAQDPQVTLVLDDLHLLVTLLIIAVLLALYEFGLHRLRQTQPAA